MSGSNTGMPTRVVAGTHDETPEELPPSNHCRCCWSGQNTILSHHHLYTPKEMNEWLLSRVNLDVCTYQASRFHLRQLMVERRVCPNTNLLQTVASGNFADDLGCLFVEVSAIPSQGNCLSLDFVSQ
jgi:hypothetical protein